MQKAHYPQPAPIDAYGDGGFRFAEMSHVGAILCLPTGIFGWRPNLNQEQQPELSDFDAVLALSDQIDVFFYGCGADLKRLPVAIRQAFQSSGIILESMTTGAAARTYNVILLEGRRVACGLLPVDA